MPESSVESILLEIVTDFYTTFGLEPVSVRYVIAEDMGEAYSDLRPDYISQHPELAANAQKYNGITVLPDSLDGEFTVLLNGVILQQSVVDGNANWIGTIAHETTHAVDYTEYADLVWVDSYDELQLIDKHAMFQLWTEVNARAKGYYFVRKYTFEDMTDERQVSDILNIELPGQYNLLFQNYNATRDGYQQAYLVAQYLGRLYTLQQLFPKTFTNKFIRQHLSTNKLMYDWFVFYSKYNTLSEAYEHFDEMKNILRQNFRGL